MPAYKVLQKLRGKSYCQTHLLQCGKPLQNDPNTFGQPWQGFTVSKCSLVFEY